jgi:hypothetical protein
MKHEFQRVPVLAVVASLLLVPVVGRAHCDTLDGPVVKTARTSLDAKDVRPVLAWVKPQHEEEIRAAFFAALEARKSNPASSDASDRRFYEALVRVHRAGEGAPYTGLKSAGADVGEGVREADRAVEHGDVSGIEERLVDGVRSGLRDRFAKLSARQRPGKDVSAGREWVEAYVEYVHYVERLDGVIGATASHGEGAGHDDASTATPDHRSSPHAHVH